MPAAASAPWWRLFRSVGTATVYHIDLRPHSVREDAALVWLDEGEVARWSRYQFDGPRRQFALCRAALRALLCEQLACRNDDLAFRHTKYGKPSAMLRDEPAPIGFNLSHSGDHGLIAYAPEGRVGVDVQERVGHRRLDLLIKGMFSAEEREEVGRTRGAERIRLFFDLWTIKEALIKADGTGLALDAARFTIPPAIRHGMTGGTLALPQAPGVEWRVASLGAERFAAAVAHEVLVGPEPTPPPKPARSALSV
ncbi:MAG: 4'-phosphopantetheinyl transferase superfamily protein [Chloroflexota bacterium]|nr:4'-phosphopantetheinyl transferase superfamily protein [Chloroflexota bacterium]